MDFLIKIWCQAIAGHMPVKSGNQSRSSCQMPVDWPCLVAARGIPGQVQVSLQKSSHMLDSIPWSMSAIC